MADTTPAPISQPEAAAAVTPTSSKPKMGRAATLSNVYALPAPLRTFPLPTLVPHNPLSLFHILYVWLSQTINPPSSHFEIPYQGWWSPETRSVHVTDSRSIRGLWEQGFYGKGSLSRSEPNWMIGQKTRRDCKGKATIEEVTKQRRATRQQTKWERARKEREAIDQLLLAEAEAAMGIEAANHNSTQTEKEGLPESDTCVINSDGHGEFLGNDHKSHKPPIGPLELLSLPNSSLDWKNGRSNMTREPDSASETNLKLVPPIAAFSAPIEPLATLVLPDAHKDMVSKGVPPLENEVEEVHSAHHISANVIQNYGPESKMNGNGTAQGLNGNSKKTNETSLNGNSDVTDEAINGSVYSDDTIHSSSITTNGSAMSNGLSKMKRQKSVRFSPTVEKNTFIHNEPPSPEHSTIVTTTIESEPQPQIEIEEQEHLQLTLEEAFFLSYSLGVLTILDPVTRHPISNIDLFTLFRKFSYFPPLSNSILSPDDPFMLNYVVYHHFRSLGWVVRGGVKFAVDFLLYNRGPAFSHAEFAVVILPSYSDPYWSSNTNLQNYAKTKEKRTWAWFNCINRVITQVRKTLVLVYVNIPKPLDAVEKDIGIDRVLGRYKVQEVVTQRWLSNRQRK